MSNLVSEISNELGLCNGNQKQMPVDKKRLEYLLTIEKHYTNIIAASVKKEIKKEKSEKIKETVLRDP